MASTSLGADVTVSKPGGGGAYTTVQAALATAKNGDTIIIADSEVYVEDVTAGVAAGLVASFTLRAAEGQKPVIRAANTAERVGVLGIPGTDYMGTFFFGCQGVLVEGITFENLDTALDAGGISAALALFDSSDITIRNCTIRGAGGEGTNYPGDNLSVVAGGVQTAPKGVLIENCLVEEGNYGVAISKLQGGTPTDPSVIVRGCTIRNCEETGIEVDAGAPPNNTDPNVATGQGNLLENNTIINCDTGISLGGGYNVIRNCTVLSCRAEGLDVDLDGDRGTQPITGIVENSVFVGGQGDGIRVDEGIVTLTNCIVAGSGSEGIHLRDSNNETKVTVDHCDIYRNLTAGDLFEVRVDVGATALIQLRMKNTNVVGEAGIYNGSIDDPEFFDLEGLFASYCNVFAANDRYTNVVVENDRQFDPMYMNPSVDPQTFTRDGFQLSSTSAVITAGENGTFIGSQGPAAVRVEDWATR
jgi:parallel beta-helix repeat protein